MAFNVGDIEARLTLDRDAFQRGLEEARAEAAAFERGGGTRRERIEVDASSIEAARARLEELHKRVNANVGVDTAEARAEIGALDRALKNLHRKVEAKVGLDGVPETLAEIEAVQRKLREIDHERVSPDVDSSPLRRLATAAGSGRRSLGLLGTAVAVLGPMAVAAGGVAGGAILALGTVFGIAGAGAVGFGLAAKNAFKGVEAAAKLTGQAQKDAIAKLGPGAAPAVHAVSALEKAWEGLQKSVRPQAFQIIATGANTLRALLPSLSPIIHNAGTALAGLARDAQRALAGPFWQSFFQFVSRQVGPALTTLGHVLGNVAHGFASMMQGLGPILPMIERGLVRMTARFAAFGSSNTFRRFVDWLRTNGPRVARAVGQIATAIARLAPLIAPVGVRFLVLAGHLATVISRFAAAHPRLAQFVITLAIMGRAVTTAALALGRLVGPIVRLLAFVARLRLFAAAFTVIRVAVVALAATIGAPVAAVVGIIGGLIAVGVHVATHWKMFKTGLIQIWDGIKAAAGAIWGAIKTVILAHVHAAVAVVKAAWTAGKATVLAIWHALQAAASAVWHAITGVISGAVHAAVSVLRTAWNTAKSIVTSAWHAITSAVSAGVSAVARFVGSLPGKIISALASLPGRMLEIGRNIMEGLFNGIKAVAGKVISFVGNVASKIGGAFKSVLSIGSPSRVFHGFGVNLMEGLANGIAVGAGKAISAIGKQARAIRDHIASLPRHARAARNALEHELAKLGEATAFQKAITTLGKSLETMVTKSVNLRIDARTKRQLAALNRTPQGRELARLTGQANREQMRGEDMQAADQVTAARATNRDEILGASASITAYQQNLARAQRTGDTRRAGILQQNIAELTQNRAQLIQARDHAVTLAQIEQSKLVRDRRIADLQAYMDAQTKVINDRAAAAKKSGDRESNAYKLHLDKQLAALVTNLEKRRLSYGQFIEKIGAMFGRQGLVLSVPGSAVGPLTAGAGHGRPAPRARTRGTHHPAASVHEGDTHVHVTVAGAGKKDPDAKHLGAKLGHEVAKRKGRRHR